MSTNPPQFQDDDPLSWFDQSSDDDAAASAGSSASGSAGLSDSAPSWLKDSAQFKDDQASEPPPWFSDEVDLDLNLDSIQPAAPSPSYRAAPDETLPAEPRRTERKRTGELSSPAIPVGEPSASAADADAPDWFAGLDLNQVSEPAENVEALSEDFMPDWMFSDDAAPAQPQAAVDPDRTIADAGDDELPSWMREMNLESSAAKAMEATSAADTPPASDSDSGSEFGWLNEIDLSSSISELPAGTTGLTPSKPVVPGALPSEIKAAAAPSDPNNLNINDLSHISSGDIDKLLNLSLPAISTNPNTVGDFAPPLPSDSGFDFDLGGDSGSTSGLTSVTGAMRPSQLRKTKPQDDLDDLFSDAVLGDEVFNRPSADVMALQDIDLQGDAPTIADAPSSTGMTGMLSRRNMPTTPLTPPAPAPSQAQEESLRDFSSDADVLPEWVADLRPADAPITLSVGDQVIKVKEEPIAKLPDQVKQLRERAKEFRVSEAKSVAPLSGPLAGITGAINPVGSSATPPPASQSALRSPLKDNFSDRVKIIQNMLKSEDEFIQKRRMEEAKREELEAGASGVLPAPRTRAPIKPDRLLIAALLLAIIIFPFLYRGSSVMPTLGSVAETANVTEPHFQQVAQAISGLQRDQRVLVAFEYAPTGAAEMDEMAKAILTDVLARGVHPVIVSTNPAGVLHAYTLIDQLGRETELRSVLKRTEPFQSRRDYTILPYLSGGVIGLRTLVNALDSNGLDRLFASDIDGLPTNFTVADVRGLRDVPTIVLAENADDVRTWMEQYRSSNSAPESLRIVLLSSVGAAAVAQSYAAASDRVIGLLVGVRDAIVYKRITGLEGGPVAAARSDERWQSLQLGLFASAIVIVVGMVLNTLRGAGRRSQSRRRVR